jgi:4-methyl-5(b-hydroxyethyl)-thiazole monophosphate biosynthesis
MPTVLALLAEGFEEIELVAPVDLMRRAGIEVTVASLGWNLDVTGRNGMAIKADKTLAAAGARTFDCLFLPGGPGVARMRSDLRVAGTVRRHVAADSWIAAICAAPTVLADAGLLEGRRYTAHFSVAKELPAILADQRIVEDGRVLTSRGAGTAFDFGLLLVQKLTSEAKSQEIASSVCA